MRTHVITKWDVLFIIIGFFIVIYPHIQINFIWKIPAQQSMDPTYWNGLTAYLRINIDFGFIKEIPEKEDKLFKKWQLI